MICRRRDVDAELEHAYCEMARLMADADRIWRRVTDRLRADRATTSNGDKQT